MLEISLGIYRVSSLADVCSRPDVDIFRGAVGMTVDDRTKAIDVTRFLLEGKSLNVPDEETFLRERSNSTILPSKGLETLRSHEQQAKLNVFDQSPYKEMACKNKKIEREFGRILSCSVELTAKAKLIREVTGAPQKFADFSPEQKESIKKESNYIGGAKELLADMDTLDAHVLATLIKAESKEYDLGDMERRKCMFNHVRSPDNPIYPWNSHRFDLEVFEVDNPIQYTEEIRNLIADRWNEVLEKTENLEEFLFVDLGLSRFDPKEGILNILQALDKADRKKLLKESLNISWSTERFIEDECNSRESNPLGREFRQHTTGAKSNVVRVSDKEDRNVNQWVFEAIVHGKPVTSGPSGHTLRYLNHYAMCVEMLRLSGSNVDDFPSLDEARLIMLANLMAPKEHHSYHEVMLASIGVFDGVDSLEYKYKNSYEDMKSTEIGLRAWMTLQEV